MCKLDKNIIKKESPSQHFQSRYYLQRFLLSEAATGLHKDDSEFGCSTIECLALWAEIPAE